MPCDCVRTEISGELIASIIRVEEELGGACNTNVKNRSAYRLLVGKPEGKNPLGRPGHGWITKTNKLHGL
jgi:hypothetical protein